jgi:hypothetical protein
MTATGKILVTVGYGKATLRTSVTTLTAFRLSAPFTRDPLASSGQRIPGFGSVTSVGVHPDANGRMYSDRVGHDPGTIVLLTASKTRQGAPVCDAALLLRLRPGAALINTAARLPTGADNIIGDRFTVFTGNADLLSVEEAELLGVRIPRNFLQKFFNEEEVAESFFVDILQGATIERPELVAVSTPEGTKVKEVPAAPKRRLIFRK